MKDYQSEWLYTHCKEAYEYQLKCTDDLRNRFSFLSGLFVLLGSGLVYYVSKYVHTLQSQDILFFYVFIGVGTILLFLAVAKVLYALAGKHKYSYIQKPNAILKYYEELYSAMEKREPSKRVDTEEIVKKAITMKYAEGATHNLDVNRVRTEYTISAQKLAVWAFICFIAATPRFAIVKFHESLRDAELGSQTKQEQKP